MIQTYTPTASLVGSDRTKDNFYQAIKMFLLSNEYIGKYLELDSESGTTLTIKTKSGLGLNQGIRFEINNSYCYWRSTNTTNQLSMTYKTSNDIVFTVADLPDHLFVLQDNTFIFAIAKTTSFDGKRSEYALISTSSSTAVQVYKSSETASTMNISSTIMSECTGYSNTYVLEKLFISGTDLICNSVYIARGGITIPPSGMSTIGGRRFYRLYSTNIMFLVE